MPNFPKLVKLLEVLILKLVFAEYRAPMESESAQIDHSLELHRGFNL